MGLLNRQVADNLQPPSARRALITGGASGLGYAVAAALLEAGGSVAIGDKNEDGLQQASQALHHPRLLTIPLDVTSRDSVRRAVDHCCEQFGGLDTLVNCAGVFSFFSLDELSEQEWDRILDINLKGVFLCCQAAAPLLRDSGRGRIVNVSSDAGKKGYPLISSYCASKFGVIGFSKAIAGELAPYGVTVNCVCPIGVTSTQMGQQILHWLVQKTGKSADAVLASRERTVPMRRMARTEDVVNAMLFFLSDDSGFVTGEAMNVDGGVLGAGVLPGLDDD
jgi:NAD(P)-dependent dehydrogenase (short-subunit alcohol dehydrogenase family)